MPPTQGGATGAEQTSKDKPRNGQLPETDVGINPVGPVVITMLAVVILTSTILAVYSMVALWPPNSTSAAPRSINLFGLRLLLDPDQQLFVVVALAGAIGGLIHSARSVYWYVGNRRFRRSWLLMYLSLPFTSSALAVVFYIILRGGLITGEATAQVNVFGFAAVAALVGLFSSQAAEKLKTVFSLILAHAETGIDSVTPETLPVVDRIEPESAAVGAIITVYGKNLSGSTEILFQKAAAPVLTASEPTVTAEVPPGAATGPIRLIVGNRIVDVSGEFRVEP